MANPFFDGPFAEWQQKLLSASFLGVWGMGVFGDKSNVDDIEQSVCGDHSEEDLPEEPVPENSMDSQTTVRVCGCDSSRPLGDGSTTQATIPVARCEPSRVMENMRKRIRESLRLSERTGLLHYSRINGPVSSCAQSRSMSVDDLILKYPQLLIRDLRDLYDCKTYSANSIKSFYSSIRHYVFACELGEDETNRIIKYYDSELANFESRGCVSVSQYKNDTQHIIPSELESFVLKTYSPQKHFSSYVTGLIYSVYPLRDDLTDIVMYLEYPDIKDKNFLVVRNGVVYLCLNKTKTIPRVYPPTELPLDTNVSSVLIGRYFQMEDKTLPILRGRRSVVLSNILKRMGKKIRGGGVNYLRRCHAKFSKYDNLDSILHIMGHSAKTHGRHYL